MQNSTVNFTFLFVFVEKWHYNKLVKAVFVNKFQIYACAFAHYLVSSFLWLEWKMEYLNWNFEGAKGDPKSIKFVSSIWLVHLQVFLLCCRSHKWLLCLGQMSFGQKDTPVPKLGWLFLTLEFDLITHISVILRYYLLMEMYYLLHYWSFRFIWENRTT